MIFGVSGLVQCWAEGNMPSRRNALHPRIRNNARRWRRGGGGIDDFTPLPHHHPNIKRPQWLEVGITSQKPQSSLEFSFETWFTHWAITFCVTLWHRVKPSVQWILRENVDWCAILSRRRDYLAWSGCTTHKLYTLGWLGRVWMSWHPAPHFMPIPFLCDRHCTSESRTYVSTSPWIWDTLPAIQTFERCASLIHAVYWNLEAARPKSAKPIFSLVLHLHPTSTFAYSSLHIPRHIRRRR